MSKSKPIIVIASLVLLLLMIAWLAGAFHSKIAPETLAPAEQPAPEQLLTVVQQSQPHYERLAATITSKQATYISPRILAPINKIHVRAGDLVSDGQLLVELDQRQLNSQRQQAQQAVAAARAQLTDAEQDYQRSEKLYRDKVVSKAELDKMANRKATVSAEMQRAQKALEEAETALSYTRITAPISGKVIDRFKEPGDTVAPGENSLSLYNPGSMRVEAHVREGLALSLVTGQALKANIPAVNQQVGVTLDEIVPAADPGARTFLVKAALPAELGVFPGMYAELLVPAGEEPVILVPQAAVSIVGQQQFVQVWTGKQLQRRFVRLGRTLGDEVVVISGLSVGEQVAVK